MIIKENVGIKGTMYKYVLVHVCTYTIRFFYYIRELSWWCVVGYLSNHPSSYICM